MRTATPHRFNLVDGMLLVAAASLGLGLIRFALRDAAMDAFGDIRDISYFVNTALMWTTPVLISLSAAILMSSLRPPRPSARRLMRRPGFAACCVASLAVVAMASWSLLVMGAGSLIHHAAGLLGHPISPHLEGFAHFDGCIFFAFVSEPVGAVVLGSWFALWASGRSRPVPTWPDRAGRALGMAWITCLLVRQSDPLFLFWR